MWKLLEWVTWMWDFVKMCHMVWEIKCAVEQIESVFMSVTNQLDAQNFCFTVGLFHASTCFEQTCSSPGGQNCITQPLVSSHL